MKKPPRTFLLVEAMLDENGVPYLVADPRAPARKVGIRHATVKPEKPDHFAEHFEPHAHIVDASNALDIAHFQSEAKAGTLKILGRCTAMSPEEAHAKLAPATPAAAAEQE